MRRSPETRPPDARPPLGPLRGGGRRPVYDALDPLRDVSLTAELTAPSGRATAGPASGTGSTPGGCASPRTSGDVDLHPAAAVRRGPPVMGGEMLTTVAGSFDCVPYDGDNPFYRHGPPRLGPDRRRLVHADGTPWFYLADTVWNGPIQATAEEWATLRRRPPGAGLHGGAVRRHPVALRPGRGPGRPGLDRGATGSSAAQPGASSGAWTPAWTRPSTAGIAGVPVLLWAISGGAERRVEPGQRPLRGGLRPAGRLPGGPLAGPPGALDPQRGREATAGSRRARWQRIGRAVFGDGRAGDACPGGASTPGAAPGSGRSSAPSPGWTCWATRAATAATTASWRWLVDGPPARHWPAVPRQAVVNLEPRYEHHNRMAAQRGVPGRRTDASPPATCAGRSTGACWSRPPPG